MIGSHPQEDPPYLAATRTAYDTVAADYADLLDGLLDRSPHDRAVLALFTELVQAAGGGAVADLGCGPGRVTDHLHRQGLDVFGIDLSPAMVRVAQERYPHLRFAVGSLTRLDLPDASLAGALAWYSVIHTPPADLPAVFAELHRVLAPDALLLLAFQVGDERVHLHHAYGHDLSLDADRLDPDRVVALLAEHGLHLRALHVRQPEGAERNEQAYLLACRATPAR